MARLLEVLKSLLLFCLILCLLFLSVQTFAYDWLYPGGMSAFSIRNLYDRVSQSALGNFQDNTDKYNFERYLWPSSLTALSGDGDRALFFRGDGLTLQINSAARLFALILENGQLEKTSLSFAEALQQDGLLLDLGRSLPLDAFTKLTTGKSSLAVRDRELLVRQEGDSLFLHSSGLGTQCYRLRSAAASADFLNFHSSIFSAGNSQPVEISGRTASFSRRPGHVFPSGDTHVPLLAPYNPLYQADDTAMAAYPLTNALSAFDYNISTLRRDVEEDGSTVYVENYSSIKLSPNGQLEFKASDLKKGVPLSKYLLPSEEGGYTLFETIAAAYAFLDSFSPQLTGAPAATLRYSGAEYSDKKGELLLYFNYTAFGLPIQQEEPYAAQLSYSRGYFTEVKLRFRGYGEREELYYPSKIMAPFLLAQWEHEDDLVDADYFYQDTGDSEPMQPHYVFYAD